jgi:energy-coupling factor transport system ATP-binding protein
MQRELITGRNFSGRSAAMHDRLRRTEGRAFFLGPYAEAALSGLSSTVADEIAIYARSGERPVFMPDAWRQLGERKPATLSGGEQVLLALHCFSRSEYRTIGVDTALEQLDPANRAAALDYLTSPDPFDVVAIDNRLEHLPPDWTCHDMAMPATELACDLDGLEDDLRPRGAAAITIQDLAFTYPSGREIFRDADLELTPRAAYRLTGHNGAGKTTLFKLLVGVLAPVRGMLMLDRAPYWPRRDGNRVFALAAQNPDHQWCGATLDEDIARRRRALASSPELSPPSDALIALLARRLGVRAADQHLYELPLAARKRLSWLWPLSGALPWIMLDEPTIGQDRETRVGLARIIARLCELGHGVVVVTHDDAFAASFPHRRLRIEGLQIHAE